MTDQPARDIDKDDDTGLYREPSAEGGSEVTSGESGDYREGLRSRRWDAAPLENPEVEKTDPRIAVATIVILGAITLLLLVAGYGSGFWSLPA